MAESRGSTLKDGCISEHSASAVATAPATDRANIATNDGNARPMNCVQSKVHLMRALIVTNGSLVLKPGISSTSVLGHRGCWAW